MTNVHDYYHVSDVLVQGPNGPIAVATRVILRLIDFKVLILERRAFFKIICDRFHTMVVFVET